MKIGYIGLGALGSELARRLLRSHDLTVWDLHAPAIQSLAQEGAHGARNALELAQRSEVVLLCLPRSSDVRQAIFGADGLLEGLGPGTLVIDQSSGIPSETAAMARELEARGVWLIDAAVSASPHVVREGRAMLMAAGPDAAFERARPVLQAISEHVFRCGNRVGEGQALKMLNNAMNAGCRLGTLEVVAMGRKAGVALDCMTEVLNRGGGRNLTTVNMLPAILQGRASTNFALALMLKDVNQAVEFGLGLGVPMPVTNLVRSLFQIGLNTLGEGARLEDMIGVIESMAGVRLAGGERGGEPVAASADVDRLTVGYVGLGAMGGSLARRLMQSRPLHVHDARPEQTRQFAAQGAIPHAGLASLAAACDVVFICLPTSEAVHDALFGVEGLAASLRPGAVVIDQTSGDPVLSRRIARALHAKGVAYVDAPVSGVPQSALAGSIAILLAGPAEACALADPLLRAISPHLVHCGEVGNAHIVKLVNNTIASICRAVSYECLMAGIRSGLRVDTMAQVLKQSSGYSAGLEKILSVLVSGQPQSNFQLALMVKDLRLAARLGIECGAPMAIANSVRSLFEAASNIRGPGAGIEEMLDVYKAQSALANQAA
ncbi:hypothetical protein GCM10023165_21040 [Variovorax defluvii]|uniref:NAD(P)-dependent oxidoreductase n=1 Tax=Variovorax defluvii TaxID=913761 RepID=A0ABP8HLC3_9BURK